jgi:hypothetical protein
LHKPSNDALVYAAVIHYLVEKQHGFGGAKSPYRHVYVVNGIVPSAGNPNVAITNPKEPFSDRLTKEIAAELEKLPPLTFVRTRLEAIKGTPPGYVINRGVLITLAEIKWTSGHTATVANNRWASGLNGQWLTYNLRYKGGAWHVNGTLKGSISAIS